MTPGRKTISLDFDGVLHQYSKGWHDGTIYDPPMPGAVEAVQNLAGQYDLVISTVRKDIHAVSLWIRQHFNLNIPVTNSKPIASLYIDDRALRFEGDWAATTAAVPTVMAK